LKEKLIDKINGEVVKIFPEKDLLKLKGNISIKGDSALLEYLGDLYIYKKVVFGKNVFFEFSHSITYD